MSLLCVSCRKLSDILITKNSGNGLHSLSQKLFQRSLKLDNRRLCLANVFINQRQLKRETGAEQGMVVVLSQNIRQRSRSISTFSLLNQKSEKLNPKKGLVKSEDTEKISIYEQDLLEDFSLTEEERNLLHKLEEEERRYKEKLGSEDYHFWDGNYGKSTESEFQEETQLRGSVSEGHVKFENQQRIIQDVIDEIWNPLPVQDEEDDMEAVPQYFPRGKTGVFDLGELVDLLREENAEEAVAIAIPKEIDYADYMVIVTVKHDRHLKALAEFVRKRFKMKDRKPTDVLPFLDRSVNHKGWVALDLGNIILHIFLQNTRDHYDLELLWTVGPLYDDLTNAKDPEIIQLLNMIK